MVRVSITIVLACFLLAACATEESHTVSNAEPLKSEASAKENILACTGLPVAGQKCGLALPKM